MKIKSKSTNTKSPKLKKKSNLFFHFIIGSLFFSFLLFSIFILVLVIQLPNIKKLENYEFELPTQVYDRNGEIVYQFFTKKRTLVKEENIPETVKQAIIAIEDNHFYSHWGIDLKRIIKAAIINTISLSFAQGASTITQQTAKLFLLTPDRKLVRKIKEIMLAFKIERKMNKNEILELYLNKAYMGNSAWGIGAAAQTYFSKDVNELNLGEIATIVGLVKAPSRLAPTNNINLATNRRNLVLRQMFKLNFITQEQLNIELENPIILKLDKIANQTSIPYFTEEIRKRLQLIGQKDIYKKGLNIHTTMDKNLQVIAHESLKNGLEDIEKRHGYRGVLESVLDENGELNQEKVDSIKFFNRSNQLKKISKAIVENILADELIINLGDAKGKLFLDDNDWAIAWSPSKIVNKYNKLKTFYSIFKKGDVIFVKTKEKLPNSEFYRLELYQKPINNGGVIALNPTNGQILAMVGGYDFESSEFNRTIQSKRQPGSAFKPIIYAAAIDNGYTAASLLDDTPLGFNDYGKKFTWFPKNYGGSFSGTLTLREALYKSKNTTTVKLVIDMGVENIIEYAKNIGIKTKMPNDLSISLGSGSLTLLELTNAYSSFAAKGKQSTPYLITKIVDRNGNIIYQQEPKTKQIISSSTAYIVTNILEDVITKGTARKVNVFNRPIAGKTGTTNNNTDAWFIGYTPQIIAGVYVGNDKPTFSLGSLETGSRAAAPIWKNFMLKALEKYEKKDFIKPNNLTKIKIIKTSGLLDCSNQKNKNSVYEYFKNTSEPIKCDEQTAITNNQDVKEDIFEKNGLNKENLKL